MKNYREQLNSITTFIFDFDGVLSDGKIFVLPDGDQIRATNVKDGYALQYALRQGYRIAIISGGLSETMRLRYQYFPGIEIYLKVRDKVDVFNQYLAKHKISAEEVLFMGDDIPDIGILKVCGVPACPSDAVNEVKEVCEYISIYGGGKGCARDVIEQTLKVHGRWADSPEAYSG